MTKDQALLLKTVSYFKKKICTYIYIYIKEKKKSPEQGLFLNTSNEVVWPKKPSNFMHGLKSAILAILPEIS